jgi:hypothetical protein
LRLEEIERFELTLEELERWRLANGDLLIVEGNGSADEIGRCAVWDGSIDPCVYQNHLIRRVRCFQQDCMAFIKLFLNAPSGADEMKRLAITTSGLYNLSVGKIRNYVVPVAPLPEQSRIVTRVTALRRLCADLRQRLAEREAVQARLAEALVASVAWIPKAPPRHLIKLDFWWCAPIIQSLCTKLSTPSMSRTPSRRWGGHRRIWLPSSVSQGRPSRTG